MPKRVCQHCGHPFAIPDAMIGENVSCPSCGKSLLQPRSPRAAVEKIKLTVTAPPLDIYPAAKLASIAQAIIDNVQRVIVGKPEQVTLAVATLFAEGHLLLEDVPGVAKTMLSRAIAQSVGCTFKRIQCTPDLDPAHVIGDFTTDLATGKKDFRFGPIFSQMVLVDEINRASPRTQSALLEAMGEGSVTMDRVTYRLEKPFMVMATQNPIDQEGTFRLPEAQMDRFLIRLSLGYPDEAQEREMCTRIRQQHPIDDLQPVTTGDVIIKCQRGVREIAVSAEVCNHLIALTRATRTHPALRLGASPRGSLGLYHAAQALAAMRGEPAVTIEHINTFAVPVLAHRLIVRREALKDYPDPAAVIREIVGRSAAL
ncbi:MAG TPA: AAA family ATPase [Candidatus Acidoferrales bacterium]|nr:AAA family ATPase [Candidatus Acidoferrales bacterium]